MRLVCPVLAITAGIAHADSWFEYKPGEQLTALGRLSETCDVEVEFRGAVVDVELRHKLANTSSVALAATRDFTLPIDARLIDVTVRRGTGAIESAIPVAAPLTTERVSSEQVLGADPVLVTALAADDGKPRFRAIVQPIKPDGELTVTMHWTQLADIRGGALHAIVSGHDRCRAVVHAAPGPGANVERIRVDGAVTDHFTLGDHDSAITVELAVKRPLVWTQTESLGEGWQGQLVTVIAPLATRAPSAKRVLFVIDSSRSMALVGTHNVKRVVSTLAKALPASTEIEAILFDRKATRVLGTWGSPTRVAAIEEAIDHHASTNGSDLAGAFALAHQAIGDGQAVVVVVTDGVLGDQPGITLVQALAATPAAVDVHTVVLAPGRMRGASRELLRAPLAAYGGSYHEIPLADLDGALASLALRPALLDVASPGFEIAAQLSAGAGIVRARVARTLTKLSVAARGERSTAAAAAPKAAIAELVLAKAELAADTRAILLARHPSVDEAHAFAVLTTTGKVAKNRRTVIAGGAPYTRIVAIDDPTFPPAPSAQAAPLGGSALDRDALRLMFRTQLQPAALACYQRALASAPNLAGTAHFQLEIGRGELTRATLTGLNNSTFDKCLLDAAYLITPPLPNPDFNVDDRTIANYPLTFNKREDKPLVIPGDADSSSPLDIDSIEAGLPRAIKAGDTSTPLGNLRPTP